mgnify:CR=1 FL=1
MFLGLLWWKNRICFWEPLSRSVVGWSDASFLYSLKEMALRCLCQHWKRLGDH